MVSGFVSVTDIGGRMRCGETRADALSWGRASAGHVTYAGNARGMSCTISLSGSNQMRCGEQLHSPPSAG